MGNKIRGKRFRHHSNPFEFRGPMDRLNLETLFGRKAPLALDVGCGAGAFTAELAKQHPEWNVLGLEIRNHWVDNVNAVAKEEGITNLRGTLGNANLQLDDLFPNECIVFVSVNFPDPWFKRRHHKRRVVNQSWLSLLGKKLAPQAVLHAKSDNESVSLDMFKNLEASSFFENIEAPGQMALQSTTGILTEREIKHQGRGEVIHHMHFRFNQARWLEDKQKMAAAEVPATENQELPKRPDAI